MFKKKNTISKLILKYTDRPAYKIYKWELANYKDIEFKRFLTGAMRLSNLNRIKEYANANKELNFNHSGNAGDIVYAFAIIKKIHELTGVPCNLYFRLNQPLLISAGYKHPLGNVMLNQKMVDMLIPLIQAQIYINKCGVSTDQEIAIDLDFFRAGFVPQDKGNIAHWCGYITGINPDLWKSWITVKPNMDYAGTIILARSERYRNVMIDHSFLAKYDNVKFLGVESEFNDIKQLIPNIEWVKVDNFLEMARIIAGCKFFIGNQSFPFSIAEALKVPRVLEVSLDVINVVPEGPGGHDFLFQDHFESLIDQLNKM